MVQVRASQIFTHSMEDAVAARKALDANMPFAEAVEKYSTCPSKQQGGDLGWMPEESALTLMGEKVTESEINKVIGPVHSEYGYHILLITEIKKINTPTEANALLTITPEELDQKLDVGSSNLTLLDLRESWEWDIARIEGSQLITRENSEAILSNINKDRDLVLIDWRQDRSPSFAQWLIERNYSSVMCLEGGIDAWADKIDPSLARYEIDEDDGYRYEDIIEKSQDDDQSESHQDHEH